MMRIVLVLALVLAGCASPGEERPGPAPDAPRFTLVTYNVNYGLAWDEATLAAVRACDADLVLLQETNPAWEAALESLRDAYPHQAFVHRPAAGGLGILSRRPFESRRVLDPPAGGWFPAWLVRAETPLGPVEALSVHLRPPFGDSGSLVSGHFTTPAVRERELETYLDVFDPALPRVIAGDFNEGPGGAAIELAEGRGLVLVEIGEDTWRWRTSVVTLSGSLDHVLHDRRLAVVGARVLGSGRSDHRPVRVVFASSSP